MIELTTGARRYAILAIYAIIADHRYKQKNQDQCIHEPCRRSWHFTEDYAIIVPLQYLKMFKYIIDTSAMIILIQTINIYITLLQVLQCQCPCQYFCSALPVLFSHKAKGWKYTDIHYLKLERQTYSQQLVSQTTLNSINLI